MTIYANVGHILLKRGNTTQSSAYTGPVGELTFDTGLNTVRVHDNSTAGGYQLIPINGSLGNVTANSIVISRTLTANTGSNTTLRVTGTIGSTFGSNTTTDPAAAYGIRGTISGSNLVRTSNYMAGVVGIYNITGTNTSTFPKAGVTGFIADTTVTADAAVMAYLDGDGGNTRARAGFGITMQNTTASSGFEYGMDLNMSDIDPTVPYVRPYKKAEWRVSNDVVFLTGAGVPTNGVTGAGFAGIGSMCIDVTAGKMYLNGGTKSAPVWKIVTSA
jgi:hypothetical protein